MGPRYRNVTSPIKKSTLFNNIDIGRFAMSLSKNINDKNAFTSLKSIDPGLRGSSYNAIRIFRFRYKISMQISSNENIT